MVNLKVSSKSNPSSVAGALANVFREKGSVEVQAIGAGALNQAIKAIAIARGFVAPSGKNLICIPAFTDIVIDQNIKEFKRHFKWIHRQEKELCTKSDSDIKFNYLIYEK